MKKTSVNFFVCFFLFFSFLFFPSLFFFLLFFIFFWLKSKTKNVKRQRSGVLRSVSNLRRRLWKIVPNGSVYPWVSAQCRLTYFNYGLWVCCAPRRIHGLGLIGKPKLSGGFFFGRACWWGALSSVHPASRDVPLFSSRCCRSGGRAGFFMAPDMLRPWPEGHRSSAAAASTAAQA